MKSLLIFSCLFAVASAQTIPNIVKFFENGGESLRRELPDQLELRSSYDFIIVGAGSAGCVVANRLSENPKWKILLIEAGQHENLLMDVPMLVHFLQGYGVNWSYKTEPSKNYCLGMNNNQCNWPRGKVMGGSSVLNYMVYTRGNRRDYENWAAMGNPGWDFKNVSRYFRKMENNIAENLTPGFHGKGGPLTVSNTKFKSSTARAFVEAGVEQGMPDVDYNGPTQIGFSFLQATVNNGTRQSTNVAYLHPIRDRKNLHVKRFSQVTKLLIDENKNVYGVEFFSHGRKFRVNATREVILSAGAINTPQILMLSGIGPKKHLSQLGIKTIVNSAVGYNLVDHYAPGALTFTVNSTTIKPSVLYDIKSLTSYTNERDGPLSSTGAVEAIAFVDTKNPYDPDGYPDVELLHLGGGINSDEVFKRNFGIRDELYKQMFSGTGKNRNTFMVFPMVMRPKSRGRIKLRSKNPFDYPLINPNYFSDYEDMLTSIRGIRKMLELLDTRAFRKINAKILKMPFSGCQQHKFNTDAYWECFTRHFTFTIYHHCGTAKMGPSTDRRAVVDPTLRVYGVNNLRVADASIMPDVITGHTNGPSIMIGEKASDMIKVTWGARD